MTMLKKLPTWLKIVLIINLIWLILYVLFILYWAYRNNFVCGFDFGGVPLGNCDTLSWEVYKISLLGVIPLSIIIGVIVDRLLYFKSK